MRIRTVLIWFIVAGVLAAAVAGSRSGGTSATNRPKPNAANPWTIPLDPARIDRLSLISNGSEHFAAERLAQGVDRWSLNWAADSGTRTWTADPERVRAAVRLLASTPVTPSSDESESVDPVATVSLRESNGRSVDIGFADRVSGGQVPVVVDVRDEQNIAERRVVGRLPANTFDAFVRTPWTAWRNTPLFDAVTANARSMEIVAGPYTVRLQRGARGWAITRPYALEADNEQVERTLGAIASLQAAQFVDSAPSDEATGLANPIASISVETDAGIRSLALGAGTNGQGNTIFARITTPNAASVVHVDRESVAKLTAVPEAYARRTPLGISGADIARVRFLATTAQTRFEARRTAGEWSIDGIPASPDERDAINRLITVLTLEPAARVAAINTDDETNTPLGEIQLLTDEGLPLGALSVAMGEELRLAVSRPLDDTRSIEWTCISENAKGVTLWASAIASQLSP
ncbi:MAG: DUF4340 domain-containing protein [Planctomycetota bacterium]